MLPVGTLNLCNFLSSDKCVLSTFKCKLNCINWSQIFLVCKKIMYFICLPVPDMAYYAFSGTFNPAQSI